MSTKQKWTGLFINTLMILLIIVVLSIVPVGLYSYFGEKTAFDALTKLLFDKDLLYFLLITPTSGFFIAFLVLLFDFSKRKRISRNISKDHDRSLALQQFATEISKGNMDATYQVDDENDQLGTVLLNLRDSLKKSKFDELNRRKEDEQRNWANEGIGKFGQLLRQTENIEELSYLIITNLVNYLNAAQGGFYIVQEDENGNARHFEMTACIAFDRKKYNPSSFAWGEGLVGRCAQEMASIFITDLPKDYIKITTGLGSSNPRSLLLAPMVYKDEVHGVIEIASFQVFEPYQISFVEKISESIASTIASVKVNVRTALLLKESQVQAEKLAKQEEIMRRNMEELQKTQLEAASQAEEFISFTNSVNHTLIRAEYDVNGYLLYANLKFLEKLGYTKNAEVEGEHISKFISERDRDWFDKMWKKLAGGGRHFENYMKHVTKDGQDLWTIATYTCVRNPDRSVKKILFLAIDTTVQKQQSLDYEGQIQALNRSTLKVEYAPDGKFLDANTKFLSTMGYSLLELKGKMVFTFLLKDDMKEFQGTWDNVVKGIPFEGRVRHISQGGEQKWFQATFTAMLDMYGEISKIIFLASDITQQKHMEDQSERLIEQLKKQDEQLRNAQIDLSRKLQEARLEMSEQYKEITLVKELNQMTLEALLDAVVTIDANSVIVFFNKAAEELWGFNRDEVLGKPVETILPPEFAGENQNYLGRFFNPGGTEIMGERKEVFIVNKNLEEIQVLVTLARADSKERVNLTAFVQRIEVELF